MTTTPEPKVLTGTVGVQVTFQIHVGAADLERFRDSLDPDPLLRFTAYYKLAALLRSRGWNARDFTVGDVFRIELDPPAEAVGETGESNNGNDD